MTITVHKKGYHRKTPKSKKWFRPTKETGWKKTQSSVIRRRKLLESTDKRKTLHNRYLEAGRSAQALSNVTTDPQTKQLSKSNANYFFMKV